MPKDALEMGVTANRFTRRVMAAHQERCRQCNLGSVDGDNHDVRYTRLSSASSVLCCAIDPAAAQYNVFGTPHGRNRKRSTHAPGSRSSLKTGAKNQYCRRQMVGGPEHWQYGPSGWPGGIQQKHCQSLVSPNNPPSKTERETLLFQQRAGFADERELNRRVCG